MLCMLIIFYEMIFIPFRISFENENFSIFEKIDLIFDFIFLADITFTFNTAIYKKGSLLKIIILIFSNIFIRNPHLQPSSYCARVSENVVLAGLSFILPLYAYFRKYFRINRQFQQNHENYENDQIHQSYQITQNNETQSNA